ncbi:MAG: response regulator [Deltaproteobacteria bacterium]|nr:response regulator [Deltaproteobacteria bacterium]
MIQKEREAVENPEGGFISYVWNKPSQARPSPKISFLKGVKEWEWMVGAGIYLDDVENEIALQLTQLNHYTKLKILYFSLISVAIIAFFLFLFSRLRLKLINDFKLFISFFNNMSGSGTAINRDLIKYAELDQMAVKANRMLQDKLKVEQDLIDEKEKLSASENKFRSMMESMVDQVYIRSADYRIEYMNPAMIKRVGRDVTGEFCYRALHDFEKPCSWCSVMKVQQDEPFESDFVDQKDDRSYHISRSHVINEDGSVSTMTIFRDTTDLKKMEEQFYQSQKMEAIGTLAGGVAHDFNNILTVIRGHAQLGMMQTTEENPLWKDLVEIEAAGNRAHKLTRQLLAFSRKEVVQPEVVLVDALVTDLSKMLKRLIGEDITFEIKLEDDLSPILADPGQIEQIIINLVVNAADAIRNLPLLAGRNISIGVSEVLLDDDFVSAHVESRPGRHLLLEISDNGCGMSEEVMARIFEPFFTTKGEHRGTGLGLSTVFGIVRQNNANIYVASEIGQGTTFKIYWPILEERRPESLEVKDTETVSGGNEVILLVEDEEPARIMARNILRNAGYTVIEAENGLDALLQVEAFPDPVDLLFTDIVMPLMGGKELSEKLTATHPRIKFLFTSGYLSDRVDRDDKKFVEECFIEKPYDVSALLIKVRRILDS